MEDKSNLKYIFYGLAYLKHHWLRLLLVFSMSAVIISLSLVPVEVFRKIIDEAIPSKNLHLIWIMVLIVFLAHIFILVVSYIQDMLLTKLQLDITQKIQGDFFRHLLSLPSSHYSQFSEGQLMEKVIDDSDEIVDSTFDLVISPLLEIISIVITITYMFFVSSRLTFVALAFIPLFVLATIPVNRILRRKYSAIKKKLAEVYDTLQEKLSGMTEIITNNQQEYETKELAKHLNSYNTLQYDYEKFSSKLQSVISIVSDFAPYTILLFAAYEIIQGYFEVGTLVAFSMLVPRLFGPVKDLATKSWGLQN